MGILINEQSFKAKTVTCTAADLIVQFEDGRKLSTPLSWYPRLKTASKEALANYELNAFGIHFLDLDEDLSFEGMFNGHKSR